MQKGTALGDLEDCSVLDKEGTKISTESVNGDKSRREEVIGGSALCGQWAKCVRITEPHKGCVWPW